MKTVNIKYDNSILMSGVIKLFLCRRGYICLSKNFYNRSFECFNTYGAVINQVLFFVLGSELQLARVTGNDTGIVDILKKASFQKYVSVCSLLAWKMITQRPQMTFKTEGKEQHKHVLSKLLPTHPF